MRRTGDAKWTSPDQRRTDMLLPAPGRPGSSGCWWLCFGLVTALAMATRLYDIENPPWVAWDETHFGKMASWYINGSFFFDVHPPLGKLLIALAGHVSGYNGTFAFQEPGYRYNDTNYLGMRVMCGAMGAAVVPMGFIIVYDLTDSLPAASFSSALLVFDVGLITVSRFILLDPIMLFFMTAAVLFNFRFNKYREFSGRWWLHLALTGLMLGCAITVKFVGVFVVMLIGFYTVTDLWWIFCDIARPLVDTVKHLMARALCLIVVPLLFYVLVFAVHDFITCKTSDSWGMHGDGWFSSGYQMRLHGNDMYNLSQPKYLSYGSLVTLKNIGSYSTYLHSHNISYPDSKLPNVTSGLPYKLSEIQSITGFRLKDPNNFWRIVPFDDEEVPDWQNPYVAPEPVLNGDVVRLVHNITGATLTVFNRRALQSTTQKLVGAMNQSSKLPSYQQAFIIQAEGLPDESILEPINSTFRLYNHAYKCGIYSVGEKLPEWAGRQMEMICSKRLMDEGAMWTVQRHINPRLANVTQHWHRFIPSFPERFMEVHQIISTVNARLKPSIKEMRDSDQPWMWPILLRGLHFSTQSEHRVYLLGNPVIWWLNLVLLFISGHAMAFVAYYTARSLGSAAPAASYSGNDSVEHQKSSHDIRRRLGGACFWLWLGWAVHFWPFWAMGRILYFHHYFPAFCFSCMLAGVVLDFILESVVHWIGYRQIHIWIYRCGVLAALLCLSYTFYLFSPLCYGMSGPLSKDEGTNSTYYNIWWSRNWDI